jgi:thioredoxin-like negative regulator of GroEL
MAPVIDSLVKSSEAQFELVKIDGGNQIELCQELKIKQFPTFVIYKQGKEIWRKQGIVDAKELASKF